MSPFGYELPKDSDGFLLWRTMTLWQREIRAVLEPHNLSHPQFVILATTLWLNQKKAHCTQVDIIQLSALDKMTVSNALKKLAALGYVRRDESPVDTRAKVVIVTDAAKQKLKDIIPQIEATDERFFQCLNQDERVHLHSVLSKVAFQD